jgi:hypothetical protein
MHKRRNTMRHNIIRTLLGAALLLGLAAGAVQTAGKPMDEVEFDGTRQDGTTAGLEIISGNDRTARSIFGPMTERAPEGIVEDSRL